MDDDSYSTSNIRLMSIVWMIGVFLVSLTYLLLYTNLIFYDIIFWTGIILSGMVTYKIISTGRSVGMKLCFLFLFGLVLYIPHTLSSPNHFHIYDELIHYQTSSMIYETGNIDINASFIISKYYPTLEIVTVFFKDITGGSIFGTGLIIIGIAHSFIVVFLYLFFRNICSEKVASIGTFAYFFNSSYTHFDTYFSYESIGLPLLAACLFTMSRNNVDSININTIKITFVQILLIIGLVITHHFSSYMLLLFMVILLIIKTIIPNIKTNHVDTDTNRVNVIDNVNTKIYSKIRILTFLTGTLIFAWILYIATIVLTYYNGILGNAITGVLKMSLFEERVSELLSSQFLDVPYYELFIRRFIYTPLILVLVLVGIQHLYSKKRLFRDYVLTLIIFSGLFFLSLLGSFTESFEIGRFSTYGFIGIAFLIGVSLEGIGKMEKIRFLNIATPVAISIFVILLLIGGVSVGISSPYRGSYSDNIRIGQQTITIDTIYSAEWFEKYMGRNNAIVSDIATGSTLKYYGFQRARTDSAWEVFFPLEVDYGVLHYINSYGIGYIAVDERLTRFISELRYYFERKELYTKDHPAYGRYEPLPEGSIKKFDNNGTFVKIYDNGNINIYRTLRYYV